ncbi:MAG: uracil-DNA glycosylase family protein [Gammaproteobacteria bacterium]|nr:uracil-DNA glycosylase family protein [Gammaproteobacteria bacterium]
MQRPVVVGNPVVSPVVLIGQAPGAREGPAGKPFAWTAGKALFKWFGQIGVDETQFRTRVYMAAVCRCFPGKRRTGGDRVPSPEEIENCAPWLATEFRLLRPELVIPVGKLATSRLLPFNRLDQVVGQRHRIATHGLTVDVIPLPHPSGASPWHRIEPGKTLLQEALRLIRGHSAWATIRRRSAKPT